jgi:hypothetical protein
VALARTDVSEELIVSIIRVTKIGERGTLAVSSSPILATLMMKAIVPSKCQLLQEPQGVTYREIAFSRITAVKT